jgi:hypothetical protein
MQASMKTQSTKPRLPKWMVLGVFILNTSLAISYIGLWVIQAQRGNLWRADFSAFYTSWVMVRDGKSSQIYDFNVEKQYQWDLLGERSFAEGLLPFNNPPHVALVFAPLAYLPLSSAFMVWTLIQVVLLVWLFWLLYKLAANWSPFERGILLITSAALPSMLINFLLGAYSLLMLICILQFINAYRNNRPWTIGLWFLVGLIKPQVMVLPGVLLLAVRRWRALFVCFLGSAALFLVSSLALGWNTWPDYLRQLKTVSSFFGVYGIDPRDMYNFRGMLAILMGKEQATAINLISTLALIGSIVFIVWLWRGSWQPESPVFSLRLALTLILGLLFSPHVNPQDGVLLIPPAALFYDYLYRRGLPRRVYAGFVTLCPWIFLVSEFTIGGSLGIRMPVLVMIGLTCWMCIALVGEKKQAVMFPQTDHTITNG